MKNKNTPYTYLIRWTTLGQSYYGVRYARRCHPSELMTLYFTSSKRVKRLIEEHGLPDVIEIRQEFDSVAKARAWEHRVLRRLNVIDKDWWINRTDNISIAPMFGEENSMHGRTGEKHHRYGTTHSNESKRLIGIKSTGRKVSDETRRLISQNSKTNWEQMPEKQREERNLTISSALRGRLKTEEHCRNISLNHHDVKGEKNPWYGKTLAKIVATGEKIGLVSKDDPRWVTGEIVYHRTGMKSPQKKMVCRLTDRREMTQWTFDRWLSKMDKQMIDRNKKHCTIDHVQSTMKVKQWASISICTKQNERCNERSFTTGRLGTAKPKIL